MADTYRAILKRVRVSPRKARLVVDLVRGKPVQSALDILKFTNKKMAPVVRKMVKAAIASATKSATVDIDRLYISEALVDAGPMYKRYIPRAQGRAAAIRKRTSHITIKLAEL